MRSFPSWRSFVAIGTGREDGFVECREPHLSATLGMDGKMAGRVRG
jgi:hypothetical protein